MFKQERAARLDAQAMRQQALKDISDLEAQLKDSRETIQKLERHVAERDHALKSIDNDMISRARSAAATEWSEKFQEESRKRKESEELSSSLQSELQRCKSEADEVSVV